MVRFAGNFRWALAAALLATAATAAAQPVPALLACSAKVDAAERLACYDSAVKAMSSEARAIAEQREAQASRLAAAALAAEEAAKAEAAARAAAEQKDRFGREGIRGLGGSDPERVEQLAATVSETLRDSFGKSVIVLDNGQMWRQADDFPLPNVRPGTGVVVKRGAMGSYRMVLEKMNRTILVVRMR